MKGLRDACVAFLRWPEGNGWVCILLFSAALAFVAAYGFYQVSVRSFVANKTDEKTTAVQLVDAFVTKYSEARHQMGGATAPVPATFRAHAIELFNKSRGNEGALRLRLIGREGKSIATPPSDLDMAQIIESFVDRPRRSRYPVSSRSMLSRSSARSIRRSLTSKVALIATMTSSRVRAGRSAM